MFKELNRFEKGYLICGIIINLILAYITKSVFLAVINGIISLFVGVYSAKGKVAVFYFTIVETLTYIILAFQQKYYSEVFISLFFHLPLTIYSIYKWTHNQNEKTKTISISHQTPRQLITLFLSQVIMSIGYYYFFKWMGNEMILISTINMVIAVMALYLNAVMSEYAFFCFLAGATFKSILWLGPLFKGDFSSVPVLIGSLMYIVIDIYGLQNWKRLKAVQSK